MSLVVPLSVLPQTGECPHPLRVTIDPSLEFITCIPAF